MSIPTPQELSKAKSSSSPHEQTVADFISDELKLEYYRPGWFILIWLLDLPNISISDALSELESKGWTVLKEPGDFPDWILLFASDDEIIENSDLDGEDTEEIATFMRNQGWTVETRWADPGHLVCKRNHSDPN